MSEAKEDFKNAVELQEDNSSLGVADLKLDRNGFPLKPQPSDDPLGKQQLLQKSTAVTDELDQILSIGASGRNLEY